MISDGIVNEGPTLLFGVIIEASTAGGDVSIYEGLDTSSGRLMSVLTELVTSRFPKTFPTPVYLDRGLYVDIGSNVTAVTLFWLPAPFAEG